MFWAARDPDHPAYKQAYAQKYGHVIPDVYRHMDAVLAKVLPRLDAKTALIVVSDHGFNTYRRSMNINSWLVENGYQVLNTPDGKDGKMCFENIIWGKTRAYSVGFNSIYMNLKGRERDGVVNPGEEFRKLCDEISEKLRNLKDPKNGQNVVRMIYLGKEVYTGDQVASGPDLVVGLTVGYRAGGENVLGAAPRQVIEDNDKAWSGDHLYDPHYVPGIFLSNLKTRRDNPSLIDIAPSVLQCFGSPKSEWMDGEAIFEF
jgi:predicted AlkP superfamily phosphohydrolase/phosphomutase